jgi:aspartyl aminopeptidase
MNKKQLKERKDRVVKKNQLVVDGLTKPDQKKAFKFNERYKSFLDRSKTEREAVKEISALAESNGYIPLEKASLNAKTEKVYKLFKGKCIALAHLGKNRLIDGTNIIASHIDAPRLDLKQNPLYEDLDIGLLKTHHYGGIRKYHWLALPLALHGTIVTSDMKTIEICIGEKPSDPVFTISDLLPHLAGKTQANKKITDLFEGEKLNLVAGSLPLGNPDEKKRIKLGILNLLYEQYGITEEDFISAEIEAVPSEKARDVGFDRSMVGAYGQDDRACAYTSLEALLSLKAPERTAIGLFFDKEEIGSEGASSAKSNFIDDFISDLLFLADEDLDNRTLRKTLIKSACLSGDVSIAMDPDYKEVHEARNASKLGYGICLTKYTGTGGKYSASDASAEFLGHIRHLFNKNKITWHTGELGKVDQGGGGTVAKFLAKYGMDVLDCGPPVLSMHSPFELSSKMDIYMTYLAYKAFYKDNV